MTGDDLKLWRTERGLSQVAAAAALGLHENSMTAYERGRSKVPFYIGLACAAVSAGLEPWSPTPAKQRRPKARNSAVTA